MDGIGPPLVTPFDESGDLDEPALRDLVAWVEDRGVDFLGPCGSTSEAELMTADERARVIETVAETASVPVLAGTGSPGFEETRRATGRAADAGADAALVVTPFYYNHDQDALAAYYEDLADEVALPVYLYSVPVYTDTVLEPETVGRLAEHPNIAGIKDSSGDLERLTLTRRATADADFDLLTGSGSGLAAGLSAGAQGGILALANVAPAVAAEVYDRHRAGDHQAAQDLTDDHVPLNRAVTATHGLPGVKYVMRQRGAPAGHPRRPHRPLDDAAKSDLDALIADLDAE